MYDYYFYLFFGLLMVVFGSYFVAQANRGDLLDSENAIKYFGGVFLATVGGILLFCFYLRAADEFAMRAINQ